RPRRSARRLGVAVAVAAGVAVGTFLLVRGRGDDGRDVVVNGGRVAAETLAAYEQKTGANVPRGRHWCDRPSRLWGYEGRPPPCMTWRGQDFGPMLKSAVMLVGAGVPPCALGEDP